MRCENCFDFKFFAVREVARVEWSRDTYSNMWYLDAPMAEIRKQREIADYMQINA
jgi:hypothetical protein